MCGRYTLTSPDDIAARFGLGALSETGSDIRPRYNISPSQSVPVIRNHDGQTGLEMMRWGFQPHWMKGAGKRPPPINARSETILERPMFKSVGSGLQDVVVAGLILERAQAAGRVTPLPIEFLTRR